MTSIESLYKQTPGNIIRISIKDLRNLTDNITSHDLAHVIFDTNQNLVAIGNKRIEIIS